MSEWKVNEISCLTSHCIIFQLYTFFVRIYVMAHRCAGGLKKLDLQSGCFNEVVSNVRQATFKLFQPHRMVRLKLCSFMPQSTKVQPYM